ncbi:signal peptidase I [Gluconobacter cerevisiae]|uniref:Signal peptidase I n=1 Tax=Gluconobacter cerevisiae TaxID=1379734 RepID=A0ABR9YAW1_9PROT|nr:signal peptidase I [Gluconobacter cerevisiae]MBF0875703.1 signal peptidase I [Gluconobacter cerevisiae]
MTLRKSIRDILSCLPVLLGFLTIHSALAAAYIVPSASMEPTLRIGDQIGVIVPSYGLSTANLPFGDALKPSSETNSRLFGHLPHRGDVVVFRAPANLHQTWIKRVIGLPGDTVALMHGRVILNGAELPWKDMGPTREESRKNVWRAAERYEETLPGNIRHNILKMSQDGDLDNIAPFTIPANHLFVMGDNRDNSADSRVSVADGGVGLLSVWNLQGQARAVLWSWRDIGRTALVL